MEQELQKLILKYDGYLKKGEANIKELELFRQHNTEIYRSQKTLNRIWRMINKDFQTLSDDLTDDLKKKRN